VVFSGRKYDRLTYATAQMMFVKCFKKAGLSGKGYTIHCLRRTLASELLNAGIIKGPCRLQSFPEGRSDGGPMLQAQGSPTRARRSFHHHL
jgi:hypothetical protein